jgi:hypothetical protein
VARIFQEVLPVARSFVVAASILLASLVNLPTLTVAQERHERFERREERRDDRRFERRGWAFAPRFGWRYEITPGFWSPYYVWWWSGGQVVLRPVPTATIVRYPTGYYEVAGDGFNVPYHWVWVSAVPVAVPPPPPPPPAAPAADSAAPPPPSAPPPPVSAAPSSSAPTTSSGEVAQWYFCPSANGYYPNVPTCPEAWVKVPARAK